MAELFDTAKIIADTNLVELVSRYREVKKNGAEFMARCLNPDHADNNPSMTVSQDKGFVHCFSCGYHESAIGVLMSAEGIDFVESCKRLLNGSGTGLPAPRPIAQPIAQPEFKNPVRVSCPPPEGTEPPNMAVKGLGGAPSASWAYRSAEGHALGYEARYETPNGKTIRLWTWGSRGDGDAPGWACGHFTGPRPIYGLDQLAARPDAQVIICEGPRKAAAAQLLLPGMVVVGWSGGAESVAKSDWTPLMGRKCVLWPDADAVGIACMAKLAVMLRQIAYEIKGLQVTDMPEKWDAADATWTPEEAKAWATGTMPDGTRRVFIYQNDVPRGTMPDEPPAGDEIPITAYSDADAPRQGHASDHEPPTQPAPVTVKLVGIYSQQSTGPKHTSDSMGVVSRRMSDVVMRAVDWLWHGKIPCGKVTGISGNPGLGKSQITASLAAVVSVGGNWPVTREQAQLGSVLLLNAEDDADDTLGPRLIAAGADLTRIHIIDAIRVADERGETVNRGLDLVRDIERIAIKISEIGDVRLVIIDPASAYMGTADTHKMADVVGIMSRLKSLASASKCAIIMVNHLNKSSGQDALLKTQGSIGFVSHARAVWGVCKDKDDPTKRYFLPLKNNLGSDDAAAGLAYRIEEFHLADSEPLIVTSRIMWDAELVTQSAQDLMAAHDISQSGERGVNAECEDFLRDLLQYGAVPVKEVEIAARKAGLHLNNTMRAVKSRLGIESIKQPGLGGQWVWKMPEPKTGRGSYANRDD